MNANTTLFILLITNAFITLLMLATSWWYGRKRILNAIQEAESRSVNRIDILRQELNEMKKQFEGRLEASQKDMNKDVNNLMVILKGLTMAGLRIDKRLETIKTKNTEL